MPSAGLIPDEPQTCAWEAGTTGILLAASLAVTATREGHGLRLGLGKLPQTQDSMLGASSHFSVPFPIPGCNSIPPSEACSVSLAHRPRFPRPSLQHPSPGGISPEGASETGPVLRVQFEREEPSSIAERSQKPGCFLGNKRVSKSL